MDTPRIKSMQSIFRTQCELDGLCATSGDSITKKSQVLQSFWRLGAVDSTYQSNCNTYKSLKQFHEMISKFNLRYTVALPWEEERNYLLGDNHDTALSPK